MANFSITVDLVNFKIIMIIVIIIIIIIIIIIMKIILIIIKNLLSLESQGKPRSSEILK